MKKYLLVIVLFLFPAALVAQLTVVSTVPVNNSKNVPLITTISVTFSEALDTNAITQNQEDAWFTNVDSIVSDGYSGDLKTAYANVVLKPNTSYFLAVMYMKALSGVVLSTPYVYHFTTGTDFAPYVVSGTVLSGTTGVLPEGSAVALATVNIMKDEGKDGPPPFAAWANVNSNGTYTIPNVSNGKYWPLAVKDVNHDGKIDPGNGVDVIAFGDSIIINGASITNLNLTFLNFTPKLFSESISIADSLAKDLPSDKALKRISAWNVDTLGRSNGWEFAYTYNNNTEGKGIRVSSEGSRISILDQNYISWISQLKQITGYQSAASSATVVANAENAGGKAFRLLPHPDSIEFRIELSIADQTNGWFGQGGFDASKIYWAVAYIHNYQISENQSQWVNGKFFLCDLATGAIILTQTMTGVRDESLDPVNFSLAQNFPNPFNPQTSIRFTIPSSNFTTLKIFDLLGKEVAVLVNEKKEAGEYTVPFTAAGLPSGIYFYQLQSGHFVDVKKMVLLK